MISTFKEDSASCYQPTKAHGWRIECKQIIYRLLASKWNLLLFFIVLHALRAHFLLIYTLGPCPTYKIIMSSRLKHSLPVPIWELWTTSWMERIILCPFLLKPFSIISQTFENDREPFHPAHLHSETILKKRRNSTSKNQLVSSNRPTEHIGPHWQSHHDRKWIRKAISLPVLSSKLQSRESSPSACSTLSLFSPVLRNAIGILFILLTDCFMFEMYRQENIKHRMTCAATYVLFPVITEIHFLITDIGIWLGVRTVLK